MALSEENYSKLETEFKTALEKQYRRGLQTGVRTVSKVVLDKLNDSSVPLMTRIRNVEKFCCSPFCTNNKVDQDSNADTAEESTEKNSL